MLNIDIKKPSNVPEIYQTLDSLDYGDTFVFVDSLSIDNDIENTSVHVKLNNKVVKLPKKQTHCYCANLTLGEFYSERADAKVLCMVSKLTVFPDKYLMQILEGLK